ncbi:MAG TPA: hypothetical protein VGZ73_26205 [Bryobacteraceae bacterium]|nr:hypothetical protein [Bryobacteraceae bacterium]
MCGVGLVEDLEKDVSESRLVVVVGAVPPSTAVAERATVAA